MEISKIIANSIKFPLKNFIKLPVICILFILICIIPIGMKLENNYLLIIGIIGFLLFLLIVPGSFLSMVRTGSRSSAILPSFNLVETMSDSVKVLFLRLVYMIVPAIVFFVVLSTLGVSSIDSLYNLNIQHFVVTFLSMLAIILIVYLIFEFLLFFAKARLAYFNSLSDALRMDRVFGDIRNIGIFNIIKWVIFMLVLMVVVSVVSSVVMAIPYVGIFIYAGIVIPLLESIANYSVGLLYSNIALNNGDVNIKKIESEIRQY